MKKKEINYLRSQFKNIPELNLLIQCSRPTNDNKSAQEIEKTIQGNVDWNYLFDLIQRHKLFPSVYETLKPFNKLIPSSFFKAIKNNVETNTKKMLALTGELIKLTSLFAEKGIHVICLKGPPLSYQLYGTIAGKESKDLDLIVSPDDLDNSHAILSDNGYDCIEPDFELSNRQLRENIKLIHHNTYFNQKKRILLELHWRFFTPASLCPLKTNQILKNYQEISLLNNKIKILEKNDQLSYLAVHGAIHKWYRLFWLKDFTEFITKNNFNWMKILRDSEEKGSFNSIAQALYTAEIIYGIQIPEFKKTKLINYLVASSLKAITQKEEIEKSKIIYIVTRPFYLMRLRKNLSHKLKCINALRTKSSHWKILPLPDFLFFLYYFLRPFIWFYEVYIKGQSYIED